MLNTNHLGEGVKPEAMQAKRIACIKARLVTLKVVYL